MTLLAKELKAVDQKQLKLSSSFLNYNKMPSVYTCDGRNINPPLHIDKIPANAKSLAVIAEDLDATKGVCIHWLIWNIPVTDQIKENSAPGVQGKNSFGIQAYSGPCPFMGTHRYVFKVYALDKKLDLPAYSTKADLERAMKKHILGSGELVGLYKRV